MKIRMKDLARMANVSETTVSLVLNDKETRISEKKKREIKELAKQYNYQPNIAARGLASNKTNMIGLIIPDIENPFFSTLSKAIDYGLREKNYYTILVNSDDKQENEIRLMEQLINMGVDGLLISLSNESFIDKEKTIERLNNLSVPYVLMDRNLRDLECNQVYFDNRHGGYLATKFLLDLGHRSIGFLKAPSYMENANYRFLGYLDAMEEKGITIQPDWLATGDFKFLGGYTASECLLKNKDITAVVSSNDMMLLGLLKKAKELQMDVPDDLSVVGYDHSKILEMLSDPITSIDQNSSLLAQEAFRLLKGQIDGASQIGNIVLEPKLFLGESTKKV